MLRVVSRCLIAVICIGIVSAAAYWQQSTSASPRPDLKPAAHWVFDAQGSQNKKLTDRVGVLHGAITGNPALQEGGPTSALVFNGPDDAVVLRPSVTPGAAFLPQQAFTVAAWMRIDEPTEWGGILGCLQDNGEKEKGLFLGFNRESFLFGLATKGADDGDGKITYLKSDLKYQVGRWYHVAAVYDGSEMRICINGKTDARSKEQSGPVLYADRAPLMIARYRDDNEDYPSAIALKELLWCHRAVPEAELQAHFQADAPLAAIEPPPVGLKFTIEPYQQSVTKTSIVIMAETNEPSHCTLEYGEAPPLRMSVTSKQPDTIHELKIDNLQPKTKYFYRLTLKTDDGKILQSRLLTFMTAVEPSDAWSFAVVGDTQRNPEVTARISKLMWERRPNFVLHNGDVVDDGAMDWQWKGDLFKPCLELFGRVPVFPTIGNHEKNHPLYYRYFSLPKPEYFYSFRYGNAEFFSLDTNKDRTSTLLPGGEQYKWLDNALAKSDARWKICYHHHPVFSSDSDDFGDSFKERSVDGDLRIRPLQQLYEKHNVDLVFNGHIHLYERSWPIRNGRVDPKGVIHITSGGGGGRLEDFKPTPTWFKAELRVDFHFLYFSVMQGTLNMKAFDQEGRLFDQLTLRKD